jgi:hypothetical protein
MSSGSGSVFTIPASPAAGGRTGHESVWQFLERSTEAVAAETRTRWDVWLSRMPAAARAALVTRLKDRHDELVRGALAELVTFVLLDCVSAPVKLARLHDNRALGNTAITEAVNRLHDLHVLVNGRAAGIRPGPAFDRLTAAQRQRIEEDLFIVAAPGDPVAAALKRQRTQDDPL